MVRRVDQGKGLLDCSAECNSAELRIVNVQDFDDILESFEAAWIQGDVPEIEDFLSTHSATPEEFCGDAGDLLEELIKIDIHHRWTRSAAQNAPSTSVAVCTPLTVENYSRQFPDIVRRPGFPTSILLEELSARCSIGETHDLDALQTRFPSLSRECLTRLNTQARRFHRTKGRLSTGCMSDPVQESLDGRFEIREKLGQGGMGRVYLAFDPRLQREVAIKVPLVDLGASPLLRERFLREGRAAGGISHPNVVGVHEIIDADECCIVSEYISGPTLMQWLAMRTEPVPADVAAKLVLLLANGVAAAHQIDVTHRDLKPGNVLLDIVRPDASPSESTTVSMDGQLFCPRITDFGLACIDNGAGLTVSGAILGTAAYMAPEQASGIDAGPRSDVFSLGVILYELLSGESPFRADSYAATIKNVCERDPPALHLVRRDVSKDLSAVCECALTKEIKGRYATARELASDLDRYLTGTPVRARTLGPVARTVRWARRSPLLASLYATICLTLVWALFQNQRLSELLVTSESLRETANIASAGLENANDELREKNTQLSEVNRRFAQELYLQDMIAAFDAWNAGNQHATRLILEKYHAVDLEDLRGIEWYVLHDISRVDAPTEFALHTGAVTSIRLAPDGKVAYSAARDGQVRAWQSDTGAVVWAREWPASPPRSLAVYQDGQSLLVGSNQIHHLDARDGTTRREMIAQHRYPIGALALSPTENWIASVDVQENIQLTRFREGQELHNLRAIGDPGRRCHRVGFSPDGEFFYFYRNIFDGSDREELMCWNVKGEHVEYFARNAERSVFASLATSPTDGDVALATSDGDVLLFDVESRQWSARSQRLGGVANDLEFSNDGTRIACAIEDGSLVVLDVSEIKSTRPTTTIAQIPVVHSVRVDSSPLHSVTWASADQILTGDDFGIVRRHRIPAQFRVALDVIPAKSFLLRNGKWGVFISEEGFPFLVNCASNQQLMHFTEFAPERPEEAAASPDGRWLALTSGGRAWIWDIDSKQLACQFEHLPLNANTPLDEVRIASISVTSDGKVATLGGGVSDFSLRMRTVDGSENSRSLPVKSARLVEFSSDGRFVAVAGLDFVSIYQTSDLREISKFAAQRFSWISADEIAVHENSRDFWITKISSEDAVDHFQLSIDAGPATSVLASENTVLSVSSVVGFWHRSTGRHIGDLKVHSYGAALTERGRGLWLIQTNATGSQMQLTTTKRDGT